jgi:hypothetical protein
MHNNIISIFITLAILSIFSKVIPQTTHPDFICYQLKIEANDDEGS